MKAKEYLREYKKMTIKIKLLSRDIDQLIAEIGGGSVGIADNLPKGTPRNDKVERIAIRLIELKDERAETLSLCIKKRAEIEKTIAKVSDPIHEQLLYSRYIELKNWGEVTEDLGYNSEEYVRGRLHSKSLQEVERILGV